jgi:hypothetical protein
MKNWTQIVFALVFSAVLTAAQSGLPVPTEKPAGEPDRITVQHILIAFKGSIP